MNDTEEGQTLLLIITCVITVNTSSSNKNKYNKCVVCWPLGVVLGSSQLLLKLFLPS